MCSIQIFRRLGRTSLPTSEYQIREEADSTQTFSKTAQDFRSGRVVHKRTYVLSSGLLGSIWGGREGVRA